MGKPKCRNCRDTDDTVLERGNEQDTAEKERVPLCSTCARVAFFLRWRFSVANIEGFNGFVCMCAFLVVCFPLARNAGHGRPVHWGPKRTIQEGRQELQRLKSLETECRHATQAVVVVDAGSSSTRPILFRMRMVSCPLSQLRVIPESIRHVANGIRRTGLREVLENWQDRYSGTCWESRAIDSRVMFMFFRQIVQTAGTVSKVLGYRMGFLDGGASFGRGKGPG
ncbi:GDA1/CD39 (nucleoside phosphatase) family protein [Toxoplasma gondii p89]|uniref:GDA1/CD39 (Nucleoside phosphatase) family protein n=1 Tax=Toxoplasma gondii p89 TaxID=943119 RepID=A0A086JIG7_TOXGO|nr:GDA1/CD39 (nucleoside phosphatase) family protein [Toxoplasma gondii p89]